MKTFGTVAIGGGILWGIWILLWRSTEPWAVSSGLWIPLLLAWARWKKGLSEDLPARLWFRIDLWGAYAILFAVGVATGSVRTSWAIATGRTSPGIVALPLEIGADLGRLLLILAITASPGTMALLATEDVLYVHCLQTPSKPTLPVVAALQRVLAKLTG